MVTSKPGWPSHVYHSDFIANLRVVLEVEVPAGNQTASSSAQPELWALREELPESSRPALFRGDCCRKRSCRKIARKMLASEMNSHFEAATWGREGMREQLLNGGSSSGAAEIIRMVLERIDWPRTLQRWPGGSYLDCFRLILDRSVPDIRSVPGEPVLHEVIASDISDGVILATMLRNAGARTGIRDQVSRARR